MLKLDVEGAEWPFLRDVLLRDNEHLSPLQVVRQLLVEFHSPRYARRHTQLGAADLVQMIFYVRRLQRLGFTLYAAHTNNNCCGMFVPMMPRGVHEVCCAEAFFLNTRLDSDPPVGPQ